MLTQSSYLGRNLGIGIYSHFLSLSATVYIGLTNSGENMDSYGIVQEQWQEHEQ